ncbi:hypothetical protein [Rhizobium leguminosarum]
MNQAGFDAWRDQHSVMVYSVDDVNALLKTKQHQLAAATAMLSQAKQRIDQLETRLNDLGTKYDSWFDEKTLKKPGLNEQRNLAREPEKDFLRGHKLAFCFVAAWDDGLKAVQDAIAELSKRQAGAVQAA